MNLKTRLVFFLALAAFESQGQAKLRKLPPNINHPAINNFAPYISLDGNSLVYIADVAEDNALTLNMTVRVGVNWQEPVTLQKAVNNRLNFLRGYSLSPDGKVLFITNQMSNGMGGFDIYSSQRKGNGWADPVNMLLPINSKGHDACPSLSVDGSTMYFMRCEKMDAAKADQCRILMMKKMSNGNWGTPSELPSHINTGNSQSPRIMGDGETLIFSSNLLQPNQGGMDLYFTRLARGQWSNPQPLTFANTAADDQYVSANSTGMYLLKDARGAHSSEIVEMLIPEEIRPKASMKLEGLLAGPERVSGFVTVFDMKDQSQVSSTRPGSDGAFTIYLKAGGVYDLSVDPEKDNYTFYSKRFDLTKEFSLLEKVQVMLKPAEAGDEIVLDGISFSPGSASIENTSAQELRRVSRMIHGNPDKSFSVLVTMTGFEQDSIRSSPDLTETIVDTVKVPVTYAIDSVTTGTRDSLMVRTIYHNDRTLKQAKAIGGYLIREGVKPEKIACSGKAEPEAIPEKRKTIVTLVVH